MTTVTAEPADHESAYQSAGSGACEDHYDIARWNGEIQGWDLLGFQFTEDYVAGAVDRFRVKHPDVPARDFRPVRVHRHTLITEVPES